MYMKIDTAINIFKLKQYHFDHVIKYISVGHYLSKTLVFAIYSNILLKQYHFNTFHWMILIMWSNTFLLVSINRKTNLQISQFMLMYYLYILKQID